MTRSSSRNQQKTPPELQIDSDEDDWDYSVNVEYPMYARNSFEALEDLKSLEGELLYKNNSIVVDDHDEPQMRFVRQSTSNETNACPTWTTQEEEEKSSSLFYQTYRHANITPPITSKKRPEPIMIYDGHCENLLPSTPSCTIAPSSEKKNQTTADMDGKSFIHRSNNKSSTALQTTNKNNNDKSRHRHSKKKHLHTSTIPPPSCPFPTGPVSSTSITDIFNDLAALQQTLQQQGNSNSVERQRMGASMSFSVTSTSIASTTLGSMDTPEHHQQDYSTTREDEEESPFEEDNDERSSNVDDALDPRDGAGVVNDENKEEEKSHGVNGVYVYGHVDMGASNEHQAKAQDTLVIDNDGRSVYHYNDITPHDKRCAEFHWEIVEEEAQECIPQSCPATAAEF